VCYSEYYLEDTAQQVESGMGQWYWSLNAVCYSEYYLENTEQQMDSGTAV